MTKKIFGPILLWKKGTENNMELNDLDGLEERKGMLRVMLNEYDTLFEVHGDKMKDIFTERWNVMEKR